MILAYADTNQMLKSHRMISDLEYHILSNIIFEWKNWEKWVTYIENSQQHT